MSFIEEFVGIQCFDIKIYMCLLIVNFCMFLKFISVIKFLDLVCIVCDNGEVIFFSVREGYCVIYKIKNFFRKNFGLFMYQGVLCVIGGNQNVYLDDEKLCLDVIRVVGEEIEVLNVFEFLFLMEIVSCMCIVVVRKYFFLDC